MFFLKRSQYFLLEVNFRKEILLLPILEYAEANQIKLEKITVLNTK